MREMTLNNGINVCIKRNENTPRTALALNISISEPEKNAGLYLLMNRLLMKGTQKYTSEELSSILDENAIELYTEMK
jgi:predicted Zn-dependent peptidase